MSEARHSPTLTINLAAIAANYRLMQARAPHVDMAAVVKADGYGMGAVKVTETLVAADCKNVYAANYDEALILRDRFPALGIAVFAGVPAGAEKDSIQKNITPVITDLGALHRLRAKSPAPTIILHVDTGMNRLGFDAREWQELLDHRDHLEGVKVGYLLSHLACPDEFNHPMNAKQLQRFTACAAHFPSTKKSLSSSFGVLLGDDYHFEQCRIGRALYGMNIPPEYKTTLRHAVTLTAPILMLREMDRNMSVGYGATQHMKKGARLATIACGYADGIFRSLSNSDAHHAAHFHIQGHKAPIVGRVSMDLITLDISAVPEHLAHGGAEVELAGRYQSIDDLAAMAGTIGYEVLTRLGERVKRIYV
jgi:alanine racemase